MENEYHICGLVYLDCFILQDFPGWQIRTVKVFPSVKRTTETVFQTSVSEQFGCIATIFCSIRNAVPKIPFRVLHSLFLQSVDEYKVFN